MGLEMQLSFTNGRLLQAQGTNTGTESIRFVHDSGLQPTRLVMRDVRGHEVRPFDNREISKFDNTVYPHSFLTLGPGETADLGYAVFAKQEAGSYRAVWGPFEFDELAPGEYTAHVVFTSHIDTPTDQPGREPVSAVWCGTVESNPLLIHLA